MEPVVRSSSPYLWALSGTHPACLVEQEAHDLLDIVPIGGAPGPPHLRPLAQPQREGIAVPRRAVGQERQARRTCTR